MYLQAYRTFLQHKERISTPNPILSAVGQMRPSPAPFPWLSAASSGASSPSRCCTCWRRAGRRRLQRPWLRIRTRRRSSGRTRCGASGSSIRSAARVTKFVTNKEQQPLMDFGPLTSRAYFFPSKEWILNWVENSSPAKPVRNGKDSRVNQVSLA
jgi:hypothetical protein